LDLLLVLLVTVDTEWIHSAKDVVSTDF